MAVTWQWTLPDGPGAIAAARREIEAVAGDRVPASDAALVASELCTNALVHGLPPIILRAVLSDRTLRIEVENRRAADAVALDDDARMPPPDQVGGRGLALVQAIAQDWGAKDSEDATCVWAELSTTG